jgi:hypothetical protein
MSRPIIVALVFAVFLIGTAAALAFAENAGLVDPEIGRRIVQVIVGLALAGYANFMPKQLKRPMASLRAETVAQAALRVSGWSFTLAGLAYAALWAFGPLGFADLASMVVVLAAMALTVGYALWAGVTCRATRPSAGA